MTTRTVKTALVTGASAGLGQEFARMFAKDGHDVILVARREDRLKALANELEQTSSIQAHVIAADLSSSDATKQLFDQVGALNLHVDYLVNNAGFGSTGPFLEQDCDRELQMIDVNISALVQLSRLFIPSMVERGFGRILNIGSTAGFQAGPYMATYYASKAFVNHFSEALAHELMDSGVTVTVSCPGPVATEFSAIARNDKSRMFKGSAASSEVIARQAYVAMHKGKRMIVHGIKFKMLLQSQRISPRRLVHSVAARMNRSK